MYVKMESGFEVSSALVFPVATDFCFINKYILLLEMECGIAANSAAVSPVTVGGIRMSSQQTGTGMTTSRKTGKFRSREFSVSNN